MDRADLHTKFQPPSCSALPENPPRRWPGIFENVKETLSDLLMYLKSLYEPSEWENSNKKKSKNFHGRTSDSNPEPLKSDPKRTRRFKNQLEHPGIDPGTSRMLSERSTIWASAPALTIV